LNNEASHSIIALDFGRSLVLDGCKFVKNTAEEEGGAISANGATSLLISNTLFQDNTAKYGGALYIASSDQLRIEKCSFIGNRGLREAGAIQFDASKFEIVESTFTSNIVGAHGGALNILKASSGTISACTFNGNDAEYGGAIAGSLAAILSSNNKFANNRAYHGGDLYLSETAVYTEDKATHTGPSSHRGGAIFSEDAIITIAFGTYTNATADLGGAFYVGKKVDLKLQKCVVTDNRSQKGAGIYCSGSKILLKESTLKTNLVANLQCENCEVVDEQSQCDCTKC